MATSQAVKQKEKNAFFNTNISTEQQSLIFMKRVFAASLSTIVYMRGILPEESFKDTFFEGIHLKLLQQINDNGSMRVIQWVKGCFDAMEKKYLSMVILGVCTDPDDLKTIIESYTFRFSYHNNGSMNIFRNNSKISEASSAAELTKATSRVMRVLVQMTEYLESLPSNVYLTMKLHYYDDVTPADYEPPGFKYISAQDFHLKEYRKRQKLGEISTPYHTMSLRARVDLKQWDESEQENGHAAPMQIANYGLDEDSMETESQISSSAKVEATSQQSESLCKNPEKNDVPSENKIPDESQTISGRQMDIANGARTGPTMVNSPLVTHHGSTVSDETMCRSVDVHCPCGLQEVNGLMIMCHICGHWQHGVCFKILDASHLSAHVCYTCAKVDHENIPTDPSLCRLSKSALRNTCLWRRALLLAADLSEFEPWEFAENLGVDSNLTNSLLKRLEKEKFISVDIETEGSVKVVVNKKKISTEGFTKYFKTPPNATVVAAKDTDRENVTTPQLHLKSKKKADASGQTVQEPIEKLIKETEDLIISEKRLIGGDTERNQSQQPSKSDTEKKGAKKAVSRKGRKRKEVEVEVMSSQDSVQLSKKQKASIAKTPLSFNM